MVPKLEELLAVELTDQETAVLEVFETVAEKASEAPARMLAVGGKTETETDCGDDGDEGFELVGEELPQELRSRTAARRNTSRRVRFEKEDIIRNSVERGSEEGQLDGGPEMGQEEQ